MSDSDNRLRSNDGRLRHVLRAAGDWLKALDYNSLDYTEDRINRLVYDMSEMRTQLNKLRDGERTSV